MFIRASPPCIMCVQYIGGCSVHRGDTMSTSGDVQYIGGCSVHRGDIMSTSGGYHDTCGGYHEYMGDVQYIGGIPWVHRGDIMSTSGGYHEYIGGCSVHRGMFSTSEFSIEIERILSSCSPTCIMISLRCTEHPPMYSWYPPTFIMISPRCTEHPPMYSWYPPDVLMVSPRCTHGIPPMYWTPPDVLNIPRCTEHPPMYWTSPDVLNTHYTGCSLKQLIISVIVTIHKNNHVLNWSQIVTSIALSNLATMFRAQAVKKSALHFLNISCSAKQGGELLFYLVNLKLASRPMWISNCKNICHQLLSTINVLNCKVSFYRLTLTTVIVILLLKFEIKCYCWN